MNRKTALIALLVVFTVAVIYAAGAQPDYCPLKAVRKWKYSYFSKKENKKKDDIETSVIKTEKLNGQEYADYEIPSRNMHLYGWADEKGVYLKAAKVSLPVLGFLSVDIEFDPPGTVLDYPVKKDKVWTYSGTAHARVLGFITIDQKVNAAFYYYGQETVEVNGVKMKAYHVKGMSSRRWEAETPVTGECWLVPEVGLVRAETVNSKLELINHTVSAGTEVNP